jgi:hypothetical protein
MASYTIIHPNLHLSALAKRLYEHSQHSYEHHQTATLVPQHGMWPQKADPCKPGYILLHRPQEN